MSFSVNFAALAPIAAFFCPASECVTHRATQASQATARSVRPILIFISLMTLRCSATQCLESFIWHDKNVAADVRTPIFFETKIRLLTRLCENVQPRQRRPAMECGGK